MISPLSHPFHWPGGIPPEINPDANGDINPEEVDEDAKGWLLFVEEKWVPRAMVNVSDKDGDYETRQDRALVETWAKASQEFRNSYHERAPARKALDYPEDALHDSHH
ncbi:hypothetical protein PENDEC_c013G01540 [Penicillium decumbens]|uniref:Uncharacterized protein n=1 Tax=Penicillium decumbens TaxID=69771 RepID=A0A1V6PAT6_PENDC|nr:hypothetical protein PENDEC_c013G01540 [Penicillium decumbens]